MTEYSNLSRRNLVVGAALLSITSTSSVGQTIDDGVQLEDGTKVPSLPENLAGLETAPAYRGVETSEVGAGAPTADERLIGDEVLAGAKANQRPVDVARYFYNLGQSSDAKQVFVREWPERANPVIQEFFRGTGTTPYGDITPWCAAFVNWCIARGNSETAIKYFDKKVLDLTTRSASSGSFRCWTETTSPKEGDLVVFAQKGSQGKTCSGQGHVAFFLGKTGNRIKLLGGNQLLSGTSGAVTISSYPLDNGERGRLVFLRFVTSPALRTN